MEKLTLGFDVNLGFPKDFSTMLDINVKVYQSISDIIKDLENGSLALAFIPMGTMPYLNKDYRVIAQSTLGTTHQQRLTSKLITATNLSMTELLSNKIGRVNQYCTTSFWAPSIYLMDKLHYAGPVSFVNALSFEDLLFKIADQKILSGMMWDVIMQQNPDAANKVHELGEEDNLPAPVIVTKLMLDKNLEQQLTNFNSTDKNSIFNGFAKADTKLIDNFQQKMLAAAKHFNVNLNKR